MASKPVDTDIVMVVGPLVDDTDFKSLEEAIAYNAAGMDISLIVEKTDGTTAVTAITLTTGGTSDWTHKDGGYYEVEITAAQNAEEGIAYLRGVCTGVLPFESVARYNIVVANVYDSLTKGTDRLQIDMTQCGGSAVAAGAIPNAAADAAGGLPISDAGGLDLDTKLANTNEITVARMGALTDWINGERLDLILDIIAADTTTDIPALIGTAQDDLDTITGSDGVTLATAQGLYAPNVVVPDAAGVAPTAVEIRQEIDSNSTRLDADISSRAPASEYDGDLEDIRTLLGDGGDIFYVSKTGDNSDGTTWAKAKTTIDAAIALCTANHCDRIYIGCGTYDETSATAGVTCDVGGIKIIGAMPGVIVKNTNTTNDSKVFSITADDVWLHNMYVTKGETTSDNAICIDVDGSYISADIRDVTIAVEKATHTGVRFTGGCVGSGYVNGPMAMSYIYSTAGVGTGIEAANCNNCVAIDAQFHTLTTGIKFTGGANCHDNMVSPEAMISSCTTGISLTSGCINNMLSAIILNCTSEYDDNSGNTTNKTDGSLTYVLDDIKTHVDGGFDDVEGAGFNTATDALKFIRDKQTDIETDTAEIGVEGAGLTDLGGMATGMKAEVNAEVVDVMKTDTTSEMSQAAPPATPTFEDMLAYVYYRLRNKNVETETEHAVYDNAGTTKLFKAAMSDDGTNFEKSEYVSGA